MNTKWISWFVAVIAAFFFGVGGPAAGTQRRRPVVVQLLAINDLHGRLDPPAGGDGLVNRIPAGGVEYLATHVRNAVRENPNSILVAAGDLMGASPLLSALFHDGPTIEAMNAMNLAVTSIGNHELDRGLSEFFRRLKGGCLLEERCRAGEATEPARFRYLAANIVKTGSSDRTLLPATAVFTVGGVKIGFIGEILEASPAVISASSVQGLRFLEESGVANEAAGQLERQGVHAIVLLIHQGGRQRPASGDTDPNGCVNFSGAIEPLARKLSPSIKLIISAHTHEFYNCAIGGHTVTAAGSYGRLLTRVNLSIDPGSDRILSLDAKNEIVTHDVAKDLAQTAILERFRPGAARIADRAVGTVTGEISSRRNDAGESALGDVIADGQLAAVSAPENGGAVVAFMNSGGIRGGIAGRIRPDGMRDVSFGDLYSVQPFGDQLTVSTMTGEMIRRLLEEQFRTETRSPILQVSHGFTYRYRAAAPPGGHVVPGSISLNGRPIAPDDKIRVEMIDFLIQGGDGFTVPREGVDPMTGPLDLDALVDYFRAHSPVAPGPQDRIVRID